jgi:fucose permease
VTTSAARSPRSFLRRRHGRPAVLVSYAAFVLVGVNGGVTGVLLPAQMGDYGVDRATIGITFFTGSAGFVLASLGTGVLIYRFGVRIALAAGAGTFVLAGLYLATRPPFVAFVLVQLVTGFATGVLESALNVYLAAQPDATALLNRLHAFFGVGALLGPVLATWIVGAASWTAVWLVLAVACVPLVAGFLAAYPGSQPAEPADPADPAGSAGGGLLGAALRDRGVLLGAAMLAVYVGLELGMGNWGFSYLVQARSLSAQLAGYSVSGYWLGLTLGRFLISPVAARIGATAIGLMYACLAGVTAAAILAWLSPTAVLASVALMLLGFFLGPVFPTMMAVAPQLTRARLVPSAIGVMNAASVVGGSALPWLVGAIAQNTGIWILLPFTLALAALQFAVWRPLAIRIRRGAGHR